MEWMSVDPLFFIYTDHNSLINRIEQAVQATKCPPGTTATPIPPIGSKIYIPYTHVVVAVVVVVIVIVLIVVSVLQS